MNSYMVQFRNPGTGKSYITGYTSAARARWVVARTNELYERCSSPSSWINYEMACHGVTAKYLGRPKRMEALLT